MSTSNSITIHRTYQLRGYTSRSGYGRIREVLRVCQQLYNRALAERKAVYRLTGKTISRHAQQRWLTVLRKESQELFDIDVQVERGSLVRLDRAFQSFFRRVKDGEKPGFPRFKPSQRYTCIELAEVYSGMLKGNRINIKGLPAIKVRPSRLLPDSSQLKSIRLVMYGRILTIDLVYAEEVTPQPDSDKAVGIDFGVNERLTLSTGETVSRRVTNPGRQRRLQRSVSRKKRGSNSRRKAAQKLARFKRKEQVRNRNECHRITTDLTKRFGMIVVEGLRVQNMTRKGRDKRWLNRSVQEQTWGLLKSQLAYKVEWTGGQLIEVNPAYTSRICSECSLVMGKAKEYRVFECSGCGYTEDRDVNAAKNILQRGRKLVAGSVSVEVGNSSGAVRKICPVGI